METESGAEYSATEHSENTSKIKSPVAKGEQANRAEKEKFLNGHFQFKQFFVSGQQFGKNFFSHAHAHAHAQSVCEMK
jgi:hypothetical protein